MPTAIAVSALVTYRSRPLSDALGSVGSRALVLPDLLTYFPCVRQPRLADGIVEVPGHIVATLGAAHPLEYPLSSPLWASSTSTASTDSRSPTRRMQPGLAVFAVDRRIAGARQLLPIKSTSTS